MTGGHAYKARKVRPLIDHFNNASINPFPDGLDQNIDEYMTKFKGRSFMRQYLQLKPIKWGFKRWFRCANITGY